ncbi:MAG: hypothetical protein Q9199_002467 [Rusavskia elegans]
MAFRRPIDQAPEQVYVSALVFSPSKSIVRQNFSHEMPQWIRSTMTLPEGWGRSIQTIHCRYTIETIKFLPHGKLLATSGEYSAPSGHDCQGLDIWDPRTGDCQSSSLPIGDMVVNSLSPDGSLVVSVSLEEVLTIWDVAKRENRFAWERRPSPITATAFSFDSRLLALGYKDGSVRILTTQTGTDHWNLKDHSNEVVDLAFSPDATTIAINARDERIRLCDVQSGSHHSTIGQIGDRAHYPSYSSLNKYVMVFSPDSKSIVISFDNGIVQLWDTTTSKCRFNLEGQSYPVYQARFSPNGELLATISDDDVVSIWDIHTGTCLSVLPGQNMDFSADGSMLALGSSRKVRVWDIQKQTHTGCLDGHNSDVLAVCFSPDGNFLASGSRDETVRVWKMDSMPVDDYSASSRSEPASEGNDGAIRRVEFSPDGKFVASESSGTVRIWQSETGDCCFEYEGYRPSFSSNGRMVISASEHGLRLFDVRTRKSHCSPTRCRARLPILSPDGRLAASALDDNSIQVWDIQESTIISIPTSHPEKIIDLIFSPTSDLIASVSNMSRLHIWDARTGECITVVRQWHYHRVKIAFSPHSELLAFGSTFDHVQLWNIRAGSYGVALGGNGAYRLGRGVLIFSPEGSLVAGGFDDDNVRLWNTETGDLLLTIPYFSLEVRIDFLTGMNVVFIDGIGHEIVHTSESPAPVIADRSGLISDLQLDRSFEWVTRSSELVLWLPTERCPTHHNAYAVWRNKIAIGSGNGLMTFLTFDDKPNLSGREELSFSEGGLL